MGQLKWKLFKVMTVVWRQEDATSVQGPDQIMNEKNGSAYGR